MDHADDRLDIAVIGTGIAGMSAAWLLSGAHRVTVYEEAERIGGHSHTVDVPQPGGAMPVDMGFIVYNEVNYPNLTALFRHLDVPTRRSDMSFAVSLDCGRVEYAGTDLFGVFAQRRNLLRPRFWAMLRDLLRFYREAPRAAIDEAASLGDFLAAGGYGAAFVEDHLLPMAAAIWSTPAARVRDYPAAAFIRFCDSHGLLRLRDRPQWRTVVGGSRAYVARLTAPYAERIRLRCGVRRVERAPDHVRVRDASGGEAVFDHVVIAAHADQALAMLGDPSAEEMRWLGAIPYLANDAVMHRDTTLMPRRRRAWASWNYIGTGNSASLCTTYWLDNLQGLPAASPVLVTLNSDHPPAADSVIHRETYTHPQYHAASTSAHAALWSLQGRRRTWFCGAYFGAGFHEDGLQAGLAVAEALGGVRRPWQVASPSGRIRVGDSPPAALEYAA